MTVTKRDTALRTGVGLGVLTVVVAGVLVAVAVAVTVTGMTLRGSDALAPQTADGGGVQVTVTPMRLDSGGALFDVAFDTHTVELDLQPASHASLTVGSTPWEPAGWAGDPAGGHHLQGQLGFSPTGPLEGPVQLSFDELPSPVTFEWSSEGP